LFLFEALPTFLQRDESVRELFQHFLFCCGESSVVGKLPFLAWHKCLVAVKMERTQHHSRITDDEIDTINPITGRSIYYGLRPYRCDDRFSDWLSAFITFLNPRRQWMLLRQFWRCTQSEVGAEPTDSYANLSHRESIFYAERQRAGMLRPRLFEVYPYDQTEIQRVLEEDAVKMRVWRHQRQLELDAKEGKIDEVVAANVVPHLKK